MAFTLLKRKTQSGVIKKADRLAAAGEIDSAIDLLIDEYRSKPNPALENHLVELRHAAFYHMPKPVGAPRWPPAPGDLFKEPGGIPEIAPDQFNFNSLASGVQRRGSLVVRKLFTKAEADLMGSDIDHAFDAYDRVMTSGKLAQNTHFWPFSTKHADDGEFSHWKPEYDGIRKWVRAGGGILAADSPSALNRIISLAKSKGILKVIENYLGERPALSVRKTTLRRLPPDHLVPNGWHQDGAFLGKGIRTVNMWIALTDCGVDAPTIDVVPKRLTEIVPTGTEGAAFEWSVSVKLVEKYCKDFPPVRLQFNAGDAIFFDEMNLHSSGVAPGMSKDRYAIEAWFFAPSCYPMDQLPLIT